MKPIFTTLTLIAIAASLASAQTIRYTVSDLGTFGGNFSIAYGVDNSGRIAGSAATATGDTHAFLSGIAKTDLGTLGGHNSQAGGPGPGLQLSILSETATADPNKEDFCQFGNHLTCRGALWDGSLKPLPNLPGGNNAAALALNSRGQIVGISENGVRDSKCPAPQLFDFQAVAWTSAGAIQLLPPPAGDTVGMAIQVNNRGQAVGISGACDNTVFTAVGLLIGPHAVLWDNGVPTNLAGLGGSMNKAGAINDRGEIAGLSSLPGDTSVHAVLWTNKGVQDLGALGTDTLGDPAGINNSTQVVGGSCDDAGNCRAFLWDNNKLTDLNDLIAPDSPYYLLYALGINDAGEIVGFAVRKDTGDVLAYMAKPVRGKSVQSSAHTETRTVTIPENLRRMLRQRLPNRTPGSLPR